MPALVTNNASATLSAGITAVATSISLTTGQGALFPTPSGTSIFYATLVNSSNQVEVVQCTARTADTLTVVRGQDGTTARAYSTGDKFELRPTAALFNAKLDADTAALTYVPLSGTGATGTWGISITGTAGSAGSAGSAKKIGPYVVKSTTYTAVDGDAIFADTSTTAFTITLPATPALVAVVYIDDYAGTFATRNLTVARNGSNIMGLAQDMTVSTNNASFGLVYSGNATYGWRIL